VELDKAKRVFFGKQMSDRIRWFRLCLRVLSKEVGIEGE